MSVKQPAFDPVSPVSREEEAPRPAAGQKVRFWIDGREIVAEEGISVLEAAHRVGIEIPSLCYLKNINEIGACRVCLVEIEGSRNLQASCVYPVAAGLLENHGDMPPAQLF